VTAVHDENVPDIIIGTVVPNNHCKDKPVRQPKNVSQSIIINFYLNLLNIIPLLIVVITGLILQIKYHMHIIPDDYLILGLNRSGWLLLHKIWAIISLTGIIVHCIVHWQFIAATTKNIFNQKSKISLLSSYLLLVIYTPTFLTSMGSWIFLNDKDSARYTLVEIHDKLALLLIIIIVVHVISRFGWMVKTYKKLITI
jgi:hypothetical protein